MVRRIADGSDPDLAAYRLVGDPGALRTAGLFVAEGRLVVSRLIEDRRFEVVSVLVTPGAEAALRDLLATVGDAPVLVASPDAVAQITGFNFHRGCLALGRREPGEAPRSAVHRADGRDRVLALEGVTDPDNVGGLFRTALAFGVAQIVLDGKTADPLYRKAIRTSMGATLRVPFVRRGEFPQGLQPWRDAGATFVGLTPRADATPLPDFEVPQGPLVLIAGAEGDGLSDATLSDADIRLAIPVRIEADSLNVVVAAGIALYAMCSR